MNGVILIRHPCGKRILTPNSSHYTKGPIFTKDASKLGFTIRGHIFPTFSLIKGYYCGPSTVGRIKKSGSAWKSGLQSRVQSRVLHSPDQYSLIQYSFIGSIFTECLVCARHCSKARDTTMKEGFCIYDASILVEERVAK